MEFLEIIVDSVEMTLSFPKEKVLRVQNQCKEIQNRRKLVTVTVRELRKLIG